ncbi:lysophospholipid acyltransferase family protein [Sphingobium boeckii]|uniref:1-acyl-sn-glycerol-3-phosphate acyltransferase n=1 Tax=Sphingobium boeckii TaxID=1082345 RepID=A0A7W9EFZ5_9SPHN|nr:lysophospholipid acyltransferase family protein [Sphingobium boeckii]MBB5686226.1 1-acyl-sn-glycerol-3-phosphate acyltransferase [Sphingobium boeckii]
MASRSIARADPLGSLLLIGRLAALIALLLFCLPPHFIWKVFRRHSPWPRLFLGTVASICGARVTHVGNPIMHDVFFVANHLSWLDILVMAGATGTAFVSKDSLANAPLVGWLAKLNNTVFIARADRLAVGAQIDSVRAAVEEHQPITVFPEGTTSNGQGLLPFKASLFAVMCPPPRPMMIQPVLLDYGAAAEQIAWTGDEPGDANAVRMLKRRRSFAVKVRFLEPFDPVHYLDRKAIAAEARKRVAAALSASLGGRAIV